MALTLSNQQLVPLACILSIWTPILQGLGAARLTV